MRILVVDDDPTGRKFLRLLFTHEGHDVIECEDGRAALDLLKTSGCDAIVSDVLMPRMDGYRLCHEIRKSEELGATPIILYTATYLSAADEKAAMSVGADKFLRKPAKPQTIIAALKEVLETTRHRRVKAPKENLSALHEYSEALVRKLEDTNVQLSAANAALRESEERLRLAATAGNIGMWEWKPDTDELEWSDQQKLLLGFPANAARLKLGAFLNAIFPEDRVKVQDALRQAVTTGAEYEAEYRVRWPDKSVHWISSKGRGYYDEGGHCVRVMGIAIDVSRRKEADETLRKSETRFREMADHVPVMIWQTGPDGLCTYLNKQWHDFTGELDDTGLGFGWLDAVHPQDRKAVGLRLLSANERREDFQAEYRLRRRDGEYRWVIDSGRPRTNENGEFLGYIGSVLDISERKEREEERQRNLERARALNEISFALTSTMNRQSQLEALLKKIETFLPYPTVSTLRLFHPETGRLESLAHRGLDASEWLGREPGRTLHRALRVVETRAPVIIADIHADARKRGRSMPSSFGLVSYAGVPLISRDRVIGVLGVYSKEPHEFDAEEVEFLTTLAGQAAIAIQNADLFEEVQRARKALEATNRSLELSLKQLESLHTSLAPLAPASSPEENLQAIVDRIIETTGADAALIRLWDPESKNYRIVSHRGYPESYLRQLDKASEGGAVDWVVRHRKPIVAPDIASEVRFQRKIQLAHGFYSSALLPLGPQADVSGVLQISSRRTGEFDESHKAHFLAIARQMAIALENRRLFDSLKSSRDDLERSNAALMESNRMLVALHAVASAASQSTHLDRVLERAVERITDIFDFEAVRIHLYDEKSDEIRRRAAFEKHPERFAGTLSFKKGQGIVGRVIESGTGMIFQDITADPTYSRLSRTHVASRFAHRFFAALPIRTKARVFGALACLGSGPRRLTDAEIQLLEALTDQLAVAVENNKLYEDINLKVSELQGKTAELEQANKVKDEFLGVVSHELRTPINVILGYTALFTDGVLGDTTPAQRDALAKIARESGDLLAMINSILSATAIDLEPMVVEAQEFRAEDLLAELKANYAVTVPRRLTVHWDYPANLPPLETDRRKLRQVLDNIIGNAVKFTEQGMILVTARARGGPLLRSPRGSRVGPLVPGISWLEFKIRDTGVGIPPRALGKVFDKFYQADSSETRRYGGVGMGLHIARKLIALLGGTIAVESIEGKGSTFTIMIPCGEPSTRLPDIEGSR